MARKPKRNPTAPWRTHCLGVVFVKYGAPGDEAASKSASVACVLTEPAAGNTAAPRGGCVGEPAQPGPGQGLAMDGQASESAPLASRPMDARRFAQTPNDRPKNTMVIE